MRCLLLFIFVLIILSANTAQAVEDGLAPEAASGEFDKPPLLAKNYLAVTANPYASQAAKNILAIGGSAIDATITAQLILTLVEPQSSGIGGGAFILHWNQDKQKLDTYDGRETAPVRVSERHFLNFFGRPMKFFEAVIGGHSVGVPGVLKALQLAHQEHGKLPWATLFQPAIKLAKNGFLVSPRLHQLLHVLKKYQGLQQADMRQYFYTKSQDPWPVGHRLKNLEYAAVLQQLGQNPEAFYQDQLAKDIAHKVQNNPSSKGQLQAKDLHSYQALKRPAVCSEFKPYRVCSMGPPSSGGTSILAILQLLKLSASNAKTAENEFLHRFIQSSKLAFADRNTYSADPDFVRTPIQALYNGEYLQTRLPFLQSRQGKFPAGKPGQLAQGWKSANSPELPSTSHLSIVDQQGNAVSMTSSIETAFGSRLMVHGFLLNNQLSDFSFIPEHQGDKVANRIQPGKRPRSSMSPTIVFKHDKPYLLIGSPGGARIIDYVAKVLAQHLLRQRPIADSMQQGHIVALNNGIAELEQGKFSTSIQQALKQKGHKLKLNKQTSGLHIIQWTPQGLLGFADSRREGQAAGN